MSELADLLERFRRGAELLAIATTGAAGTELDFKPAPDKWSVRQVVCHLADTEAVYVMRIRQVLAEDNPVLKSFNGDAWAERLDYNRRKISHALETFRRLRTDNFDLLKEMPEEAFLRPCTHAEAGPWTLQTLIQNCSEHLEDHVKQIQSVRAAYRETRAKQVAG
ncbi:MAG: DinB family protein [Bryobacterales bacterium]|nr:DinB family protein [Bryobacterales bacterium]MBV9400803.1 DinB family protein [Bryobacterales bacterium]